MNSHIFLVGFIIYALAMIWLGWYVSRNQKSGEDFLLGGRSLPLFLTLGSTVATMVGTGSSMGAVGFGYSNGWAGMLYGVGGAIGILLVAWLFAAFIVVHVYMTTTGATPLEAIRAMVTGWEEVEAHSHEEPSAS